MRKKEWNKVWGFVLITLILTMSLSLDKDSEKDKSKESLDINATKEGDAMMMMGGGQEIPDPWQLQGLRPYGQYFNNLSEYVSPVTGQLIIKQKDFVLPGRGLNLVIGRIYVSPEKIMDGNPSKKDPYIMTNLGEAWKLNLPWIGENFIYLENGTLYKIEWDGNNEFINHKGSHFKLKKEVDESYVLFRVTGTQYHFDTEGKLEKILDTNGNFIQFTYGDGGISSITDTTGKIISFIYQNGKLTSISYGARTISYTYNGDRLVSATDPENRMTEFEYNSSLNEYLISKIIYPTGACTEYEWEGLATGFICTYEYQQGGYPSVHTLRMRTSLDGEILGNILTILNVRAI